MSAEESPPMAGRLNLLELVSSARPSEVILENQCPGGARTARRFSANRTMAGNRHEWFDIKLVFHGTTNTATGVRHNAILSYCRTSLLTQKLFRAT